MASVLAYTSTSNGEALPRGLALVHDARAITSILGATLYAGAVVPQGPEETEELINAVGSAGADKAIVVTGPRSGQPLWGSHGDALLAMCKRVEPTLILLLADEFGRDAGPRLAAELGVSYVADAQVESDGDNVWLVTGELGDTRKRCELSSDRRVVTLRPSEIEGPRNSQFEEPEVIFIESVESGGNSAQHTVSCVGRAFPLPASDIEQIRGNAEGLLSISSLATPLVEERWSR